MTRLITENDVEQLLDMATAIAALETAHRELALGQAQDTPRERTRTPQTTLHILQGAHPAAGVMGFKAYTSNRTGNRFWVHLFDLTSGAPLAMIEANHLGRIRTGAAAGLATRVLAAPAARVLGVIGAGFQAQTQIEAVCHVRDIEEVRVHARRPEPLAAFCEAMTQRAGRPVRPVASAREAVEGADIVSTITTSATPVLQSDWLAPGTHINAAGANSLIRRELDEPTLRRARVICVDSRATALRECGDLLPVLEKGRTHPGQWAELGQVLEGLAPGRRAADDITVFESQGLAIQDLAVGAAVLALLQQREGISR